MFTVGMISFVILCGILIMFGKLIKHQIKIWLLRDKGYIQIRHIRDDMNEDNYFIRIKDDHFDFAGGVYLDQKDTKTKSQNILPLFNYDLLSKKIPSEMSELEKQLFEFFENIKKNKLMDIKTFSNGISTITYKGTNPNPINYSDIKKVYDAKNIASLIKRILMTKEWKLVRMVLILCAVALCLWVILGFLDYGLANKNATNLANCHAQLNYSTNQWITKEIIPTVNITENRIIFILLTSHSKT